MLALVLVELLAWSLSIPGSPEVDLMHDVIGLAIADAVAALVACASTAGIQPVISDLLLEGVVEVLLGLADSHVTCWLGDCALVVVGLVVHLGHSPLHLSRRICVDRLWGRGGGWHRGDRARLQ